MPGGAPLKSPSKNFVNFKGKQFYLKRRHCTCLPVNLTIFYQNSYSTGHLGSAASVVSLKKKFEFYLICYEEATTVCSLLTLFLPIPNLLQFYSLFCRILKQLLLHTETNWKKIESWHEIGGVISHIIKKSTILKSPSEGEQQ